MSKVIEIDLSDAGIKSLQKQLKDYDKWIKAKIDELCKRLAEYGVERAEVYFGYAEYDGINDVTVEPAKQQGKNCYVVKASGTAILFIEFGTGVHYPDAPLDEYINAEGMVHGSYGKGLGNNDYWFYTGQPGNAGGTLAKGRTNTTITHGNQANMPMYYTKKDVEAIIPRIVKEVFKS